LSSDVQAKWFWHKPSHQAVLVLALPMILSNITTPLLGMVDTAVIGHMGSVATMAGASVGAMILTQLYWVCGFLRMSVTGLSAQSLGRSSLSGAARDLYQALFIALCLGLTFLLAQDVILDLGLYFAAPSTHVSQHIQGYFEVRIWGAPAAMANLAVTGWLIGQQKMKAVMWIQIIANSLNAILDLILVFVLDMGVEGVALASVCAEYFIVISACLVASKGLAGYRFKIAWLSKKALKPILSLNTDMLLRNLALQLCLAFITFQGARLGEMTVSINAILMQFFVLAALGLDGIAQAVEAQVGQSKGANNARQLAQRTYIGLFWSSLIALLYGLIYWLFARDIIGLLTNIDALIDGSHQYLLVIVLLPLMGHWCFLYDGVFVGLTRGRAMRNSMLLGALLVFFPLWWKLSELQNWALWIALLAFLLFRGLSLGGYFVYLQKRRALLY